MIFKETKLKGAFVIELEKKTDDRGFFARNFCRRELEAKGLKSDIAQANVCRNLKKGTLRGMHYQKPPHEEVKFVRCTHGAVYDVIVDLRPKSPTYTKWAGVELTEDNYKTLYVPEGFAHGYLTLTKRADVFYMVSQFYTPQAEAAVRYNDPVFKIRWPIPVTHISKKDKNAQDFLHDYRR